MSTPSKPRPLAVAEEGSRSDNDEASCGGLCLFVDCWKELPPLLPQHQQMKPIGHTGGVRGLIAFHGNPWTDHSHTHSRLSHSLTLSHSLSHSLTHSLPRLRTHARTHPATTTSRKALSTDGIQNKYAAPTAMSDVSPNQACFSLRAHTHNWHQTIDTIDGWTAPEPVRQSVPVHQKTALACSRTRAHARTHLRQLLRTERDGAEGRAMVGAVHLNECSSSRGSSSSSSSSWELRWW